MANFLKSLFVKGVEIDTAGAITGDVLKYNGTKFGAASAGGGSVVGVLDDLTDVVITTPATTQYVRYNGTNWVNQTISAGDVPTLNQNTTGSAATATNVAYSGLTGTVPTWNQNTTGSAATWTTARTITLGGDLTGSVSINGSANATLTATIAANSVALGTDTTGNYVGTITAGTGIATSGASIGEGIAHSISLASGVATIGTYKSVTVDTYGRVTAGTNPTTLAGYGITDAQKAITVSDTAPVSPAAGNLWYKSNTGAMYIRYDSFWIEVGSPSSGLDGGSA